MARRDEPAIWPERRSISSIAGSDSKDLNRQNPAESRDFLDP
jgi:hypothetical protein